MGQKPNRYPFNFKTVHERPKKIPIRCRAPFDSVRFHDHDTAEVVIVEESGFLAGIQHRQCRLCGRWQYLNILNLRWCDDGWSAPVPAAVGDPHTWIDPIAMRAARPDGSW